jgi:hypothetical protein
MLFSFYKKFHKSSQIYVDLRGQVKCESFTFTQILAQNGFTPIYTNLHIHIQNYTFTLTQSVKKFATYTCTMGMSKTYTHRTLVGNI